MDPVLAGNYSCIATIHTIHGDHNGVTVMVNRRVDEFPQTAMGLRRDDGSMSRGLVAMMSK